jgi:hypothetical protein
MPRPLLELTAHKERREIMVQGYRTVIILIASLFFAFPDQALTEQQRTFSL